VTRPKRSGPGLVITLSYFDRRMADIRATTDPTEAMRKLADLAMVNALDQRRRTYGGMHS
jgi:hypothetical protein